MEELNIPKKPEEFAKECAAHFRTVLNTAELKPGKINVVSVLYNVYSIISYCNFC